MKYSFDCTHEQYTISDDFVHTTHDGIDLYTVSIPESHIAALLQAYERGALAAFVDTIDLPYFLIILHDKLKQELYAVNDKFGNHEIFFSLEEGNVGICSEVSLFKEQTLSDAAVYEFLTFQTIAAPRTIYQSISIVPIAHMLHLQYGLRKYTLSRYWNVEALLSTKAQKYEEYLTAFRDALTTTLVSEYDEKTVVSLSGGIDSGGILGILTKATGAPVKSISFGAQGPQSVDLVSARKTVAALQSPNTEIYPDTEMLRLLASHLHRFSQPVSADFSLANMALMKEAHQQGAHKIFYGYGVQMVLGNLLLNRLNTKIGWFDRYAPTRLKRIVYSWYVNYKGYSVNSRALLLARSWAERMFYLQGALFTREKEIYTKIPDSFVADTSAYLESYQHLDSLPLSERFVMMHISSWMNYLQQRHYNVLGSVFGIKVFSPFDTPAVAKVMFSTPNEFRKKNRWDKQPVRDALRPFIPEHLYQRVGHSLLVPYSFIFAQNLHLFEDYLRQSFIVREYIDLQKYKAVFQQLPEPGLHLVRLLHLSLWYDARHNNQASIDIYLQALAHIDIKKELEAKFAASS